MKEFSRGNAKGLGPGIMGWRARFHSGNEAWDRWNPWNKSLPPSSVNQALSLQRASRDLFQVPWEGRAEHGCSKWIGPGRQARAKRPSLQPYFWDPIWSLAAASRESLKDSGWNRRGTNEPGRCQVTPLTCTSTDRDVEPKSGAKTPREEPGWVLPTAPKSHTQGVSRRILSCLLYLLIPTF